MVNVKNIALAGAALLGFASAAPHAKHAPRSTIVQDGYIIKLKPGVDESDFDFDSHISWVDGVHKRNMMKRSLDQRNYKGVERQFSGRNHWQGYSGHFDASTIEEIRNNPNVAYIEEDQEWEIDHIVGNRNLLNKRDLITQSNSSWGLAAISHRAPGNDEYIYEETAGENTYAYVVDTGILTTHEEFEDRAEKLFSAFPDDDEDTDGHGTHVAGTIVGKTHGVAKLAKVYGVKVFQGSTTSTAAIVAGVDAAIDHIIENDRVDSSVINMSLGGPSTTALDEAVIDATSQGIVVVVAAGNYMEDIADVSPARTPSSITVGAINSGWDRWVDNRTTGLGSNIGGEMDIWGPGQDVISAYPEADDAYEVLSGTSMAAPHIAGLVLYSMSVDGISGVKEVTKHLIDTATSGVVGGKIGDSPNLLGNNGNGQAKMAVGRSEGA